MSIDLRLGDWRDVLADVECDALITDPPYSARVHKGFWSGCTTNAEGAADRSGTMRPLEYAHWGPDEFAAFVDHWSDRCSGWMVLLTDHSAMPSLETAYKKNNRYGFPPLPFTEIGKCPRMSGDGPASWTCWISVSRPRRKEFLSWGSLPGSYIFRTGTIEAKKLVVGGKPLALMSAIIRDYTKPGDLVCDPCAGGGTTLVAAESLGRRAIGAEIDPETHAKAMARIRQPLQRDMFA